MCIRDRLELLEDPPSKEKPSAVGSSVVGQANLHAIPEYYIIAPKYYAQKVIMSALLILTYGRFKGFSDRQVRDNLGPSGTT